MRIPSGTTDQVIFFVAVDATDLKTRETGLTTFTVYRARDTGAATAMTTPTVAELSAVNMPGVYSLLLDEDMTIAAGNDSEEMVFHITQASMAPVTRSIELYRPKATLGNTLDVTATGAAGIDLGNVENQGTTLGLTGTTIATVTTTTTATNLTNLPSIPANWITTAGITDGAYTAAKFAAASLNGKGDWNIGKTGYSLTQTFPTNFADLAITVTTGRVTVGTNADKTGYSLTATTGLGNQTANITGSLSGSVGSVTGAVGSVTGMTASDVGAIKAKTDSLTFTVAGQVDANIQSINDVTITGNGGVTPFTVA